MANWLAGMGGSALGLSKTLSDQIARENATGGKPRLSVVTGPMKRTRRSSLRAPLTIDGLRGSRLRR